MKKLFFLLCATFLFIGANAQLLDLSTVFNQEKLVGHWEFKDGTDPYKATIGKDLTALNPTLTRGEVIDGINTLRLDGTPSKDAQYKGGGLSVAIDDLFGEGTGDINKFCIMYDLKVDADRGKLADNTTDGINLSSLYFNETRSDGCAFIGFSNSAANRLNGIGQTSYELNVINPGEWHRIIINTDLDNGKQDLYIVYPDGEKVIYSDHSKSGNQLVYGKNIVFLGDAKDNDYEFGRVNTSQIVLFNDILTDEEIDNISKKLEYSDPLSEIPTIFNEDKLAGLWEFKNQNIPLKATKGNDLVIGDPSITYWQEVDGVSTMRLDGKVKPALPLFSGMSVEHGLSATDGTNKVQKFCLMYDIKIDPNKGGGANLSSLYYTGTKTDGCIFVSFSDNSNAARINGVGNSTYGTDILAPGEWQRIILNFDLSESKQDIYVVHQDGTIKYQGKSGDPERNHIVSDKLLYLLGDNPADDEHGRVNISRIALFNDVLTEDELDNLMKNEEPEPENGLPLVSKNDNGPWYTIQVLGSDVRVGLAMTADTIPAMNDKNAVFGKALASSTAGLEKQLWRFEIDEDGKYTVINKSTGEKMSVHNWEYEQGKKKDAVSLGSEPNTKWELVEPATPNKRWIFKATNPLTESSPYMHQGNSGYKFGIIFEGEDHGKSDNSQFKFTRVKEGDVIISAEKVEFGIVKVNASSMKKISIAKTSGIEGDISATVNGEGYTISSAIDNEAGGASVEITFIPTELDKLYKGTLTVTVGTETFEIPLLGATASDPGTPTISNETNGEFWYYMNWHRAGEGKSLTDAGLEQPLKNVAINFENNKGQIWKLQETGDAGRFLIENPYGHYVVSGKDPIVSAIQPGEITYELKENVSYTGITAFSIWNGNTTTALDHKNSGTYKDCIATWSGESGVSKGAAVTFIPAPAALYTNLDELDFGMVSTKVGVSAPKNVTVIPVNIPSYAGATATIEGEDAAAFEVTTASIAKEMELLFKPTEEKEYSAKVILVSGDYSTSFIVKGLGLGNPKISFDKEALEFGNVTVNKKRPMAITVTEGFNLENPITYTLTGDNVADFEIDETSWTGLEDSKLYISVLPTEKKEYKATLTFTTTGLETPVTVELTATGVDAPELPFELSTTENDKWYYIFSERGNAYVQDEGVSKAIETNFYTGTDNQLWAVYETEYSGYYLIKSKAGNLLGYNKEAVEGGVEADRFITVDDGSLFYFDFSAHTNEGFWQILLNEYGENKGSFINKGASNLFFGSYGVNNDGGNSFKFIPEATEITSIFPKVSSETNEYWYYIQFQNKPTLVVQNQGVNESMKAADKNNLGSANQLWKVVGTEGEYKLVSKANPTAYTVLVDSAFTANNTKQKGFVITNSDTVSVGTSFDITITPKGYLAIVPDGEKNGFNPFGGANAGNFIGLYGVTDVNTQIQFAEWADATLETLSVDKGTLTPVFSKETFSYTVNVASDVTSINVAATSTDANANVTGNRLYEDLKVGDNTIEVTVTSATGANSLKYTINVIRENNDATLKSLTVNQGELSPAFSPEVKAYFVSIQTVETRILISAAANDEKATVEGTGLKSLNPGKNEFTVTVTAQDGKTKEEYEITVQNGPVGVVNPDSSDIIISSENGILTVEFEGTKDIQLFSITGLLMDKVAVTTTYTKALSQGTYVLIVDGITYKVLVK